MRQLLGLGCPASKKIGDVSDGVNRAGVLHPCGSDDGNSSQMLRTSAGGGGDQNQVAHLRNAFFQTYDHANRRLLAIDVGVEQIDDALEADSAGRRALLISLGGLGATAVIQAAVVVVSGSVALLGDTLHNVADALTAVPLLVAFTLARRPPTKRYTYGFGRAEDLGGLFVIAMIALSSALACYVAITRLIHPHGVSHLWVVAAAALVGFAGNEVVARYRNEPLHVISTKVMQALDAWIGAEEQPDDITLVLARQA